jgi:hypothetical protein
MVTATRIYTHALYRCEAVFIPTITAIARMAGRSGTIAIFTATATIAACRWWYLMMFAATQML